MKAVFFDIDGTLFIEKQGVPASTVEAITKIRENGHKAFICTGRSRAMIPQTPILDIGFDGIVTVEIVNSQNWTIDEHIAHAIDTSNRCFAVL